MGYEPSIFKAYDIRGIYPTEIDEEIAYKIGNGYVGVLKPEGAVVVGRDVRLHSQEIQDAIMKGITDAGVDVIDIGLSSTEMLYFAVGNYKYYGGLQSTASHNPKEYQGVKIVKSGVEPVSDESGIMEIKEFAESNKIATENTGKIGKITKKDILNDYCDYVIKWIDKSKIKNLKVVYNPNFGFEGKVLERLVERERLPLDLVPLNEEPNGNFPKGRPDPFIPENRTELVEMVKSTKADLGVAWDADADRVFFCSDNGTFLESYFTNTILIKSMLQKYPGSKIVYDPRYTWALIDATKDNGGTPVIARVGHSYIKEMMRKEDAIFSGESSGHTYYKDFWYSDNGLIPLLQMLEYISVNPKKLSEIIEPVIRKYIISGEINSDVKDKEKVFSEIEKKYFDAKIDKLDGISIEYNNWRANVRGSNTEPKMRLNVEAKTQNIMEEKRDELLKLIRK